MITRWIWGLIIVFIGVVLLGANLGWWSTTAVLDLWQLWPLILILWGVSLIFKRWSFGWIIVLIAFLAGLWIAVAWLLPNSLPSPIKHSQEQSKISDFNENLASDITSAEVTIKAGASEINVSASTDKLFEGTLDGPDDPNISVQNENGKAIVEINTTQNNHGVNFRKNKLDLKLSNKIPIKLNFDSGASSINADCSDLVLSGSILKVGASSIDLKINKVVGNAQIDINAGASSISLSAPKDLGIQIKTKSGLSSSNFRDFTKTSDNVYQNANYQDKSQKLFINIDSGVSSIEVTQS
jgi:hypothetical protein